MSLSLHALAAGAATPGVNVIVINSSTGAFVGTGSQPLATGVAFTSLNASNISWISCVITVGINATTARIDYTDTQVNNTLKAGSWIEAIIVA